MGAAVKLEEEAREREGLAMSRLRKVMEVKTDVGLFWLKLIRRCVPPRCNSPIDYHYWGGENVGSTLEAFAFFFGVSDSHRGKREYVGKRKVVG